MKTLDFAGYNANQQAYHYTTHNDYEGFILLLDKLPKNAWVVMEATGVYYLKLAHFLVEKGYQVSVVNPLKVRRYAQMRMSRTKTDAKDACLIAQYAISQQPEAWKPDSKAIAQMNHRQTILEGFIKQKRALLNQLHALEKNTYVDDELIQTLKDSIEFVEQKIKELEKQLECIAQQHYGNVLSALRSIPGIGHKTSICLITLTHGFERFDHVKKLISYVGLAPRIYESGTSVRGRTRICKMGMGRIRQLLYMCSWTAKSCNQPCKNLYERLKAKGKPERVIKIAIANKLLRQAFAIAKNNSTFNPNFQVNTCF